MADMERPGNVTGLENRGMGQGFQNLLRFHSLNLPALASHRTDILALSLRML